MGKLLVILGLILIAIGAVGTGYGFIVGFQNAGNALGSAMNTAVNADNVAASYCNPGETLDQATGPSSYTPGSGYGRSITYTCVDSAGNRRDVTGQFATNLVGSVFGAFNFPIRLEFIGLLILGIVLLVVGSIVWYARRDRTTDYLTATFDMGYTVSPTGGQPPLITVNGRPISSFNSGPYQASRWSNASPADLTRRLQQLAAARDAGLISPADYEHLRQQLLDSMQKP